MFQSTSTHSGLPEDKLTETYNSLHIKKQREELHLGKDDVSDTFMKNLIVSAESLFELSVFHNRYIIYVFRACMGW